MGELQGQVYGSHKLPIGESTIEMEHALRARALTWWREAIVGHTASLLPQEEPYNILVVSHGGFISTLVRSLTQSRQVTSEKVVLVPSLPNVSMSVIEWDGEVWRLVKYGDASHLSADEEALDHNVDEIRI
jgi:broad specificity phosphatase PhoE